MREVKIIETHSPEETFAFGKLLGEQAVPGQVLCLDGDLGVGKTVFTQGFAAGLAIDGPVNSPTFTIVQVYEEGRLPLYHFDVYRIGDVDGDYRIFEHNNLNMVLEMQKTLSPYVERFCISHMAMTLHTNHAELSEKMAAHDVLTAFDGMETEV